MKALHTLGFALALAFSFPSASLAELSVGDLAPDFSMQGSDGKTHSLASVIEANEGLVLAWFPKAFTPG